MPLLNTADAIHIGSNPAQKVYLGEELVWEPGAWTPMNIPGLAAWIDPAQDTFPHGQPITSYTEHSGNGRVFGAWGVPPMFDATPGRHRLTFQPGNDALGYAGWNPGPNGLTFVAVTSTPADQGGMNYPMLVVYDAPDGHAHELRYWESSAIHMQIAPDYAAIGESPVSGYTETGDREYIHVMRVEAGATYSGWVNRTRHIHNAFPAGMPNTGANLDIGRRNDGYLFVGTMAEVLVYEGAMSDTDREALVEYLIIKHSINPEP